MIQVAFDDSPLRTGHAMRGVGTYTRSLKSALQDSNEVELLPLTTPLAPETQLIHYPYFDLFSATLPLVKIRPTVVTIHDVIPLLFPSAYPKGLKGTLYSWHQRLSLRNISAVITDSEASKADIIKYLGVPASLIHVIYLAANPELQVPAAEVQRTTLKRLSLPEKYLLYVGDINYNKNLPQLIKSLKFLPSDLHLVCVGKNFVPLPIPEWQALETQMALSDVGNRVHFVTDIKADELTALASVFHHAAAYVQPSLYEGFGLPLLEAMQCQTPVIAAANSSLLEVGKDHSIFVEPNAEAIAESVKVILEWSPSQREQHIESAYAWSQTFSWSKTAAATQKVYQQCLA